MSASTGQQRIFWLGDTLWSLYGDVRDRLFGPHGLRLDQWKEQGRATLVKSGAGRTIYHVKLPELDLYVKHFRATTLVNLLHQMVRRGRAEKEFHLAHVLKEHGVATVNPIALGERRVGGVLLESYLLTEAIAGGQTLYDWIENFLLTGRTPLTPALRTHVTHELADLAAKIHEAGIEHRDLHERNIVLQPKGDGFFRFYLLDLHELRMRWPLRWGQAQRELTRAGRYFTLRTTRTDRLRFFVRYCRQRGIAAARIKALAREAERATLESRADFWRRRDTRPIRKIPRIREYRGRDAHAFAVLEIPNESVRRLMKDPETPFASSVLRWWKDGPRTRVAEVELLDIRGNGPLIYKQYHFKGWHEALAARFRPNQATRAWNIGAAMILRELPTPRPLALIHRLRFGLPVTSYLVTERIPNAMPITTYLDHHLPRLEPAERRQVVVGVLEQSARLLRTMHQRGVSHRDLKASNVLLTATDDLAKPKFWLIDLDGARTWLRVPEQNRLQNLTRFYVSFHSSEWITTTDRLRFLRIYLAGEFHMSGRWREVWHEIARQTDRKIQRNLAQGRSVV